MTEDEPEPLRRTVLKAIGGIAAVEAPIYAWMYRQEKPEWESIERYNQALENQHTIDHESMGAYGLTVTPSNFGEEGVESLYSGIEELNRIAERYEPEFEISLFTINTASQEEIETEVGEIFEDPSYRPGEIPEIGEDEFTERYLEVQI